MLQDLEDIQLPSEQVSLVLPALDLEDMKKQAEKKVHVQQTIVHTASPADHACHQTITSSVVALCSTSCRLSSELAKLHRTALQVTSFLILQAAKGNSP